MTARECIDSLHGNLGLLVFVPPSWDPMALHEVAAFLENIALDHVRAIGVGFEGSWRRDVHEDELSIVGDLDADGTLAAYYGVAGTYAVLIIDGDGTVCWRSDDRGLPEPATVSAALRATEARRGTSRRTFLVASLAAAFVAAGTRRSAAFAATRRTTRPRPDRETVVVEVGLTVNGQAHTLFVDPRTTTVDALRNHLRLTGTKVGCAAGQCGACTILVDGRRELSCLSLAVMHEGRSLTTIEGIAHGDTLHPMQQAFISCDGLQCGFCTPGQIMSAIALVHENDARTDDDIRELMSGNLCRCGAYPGIVAAVKEGRARMGAV